MGKAAKNFTTHKLCKQTFIISKYHLSYCEIGEL